MKHALAISTRAGGISVSTVTGAQVRNPGFDFRQDDEMFSSSKRSPPPGTTHPHIQRLRGPFPCGKEAGP
jgi:hypothetical protein